MGSITPQAQIELPSSERCEPGSFSLAIAKLPDVTPADSIEADLVASQWVDTFNKTLKDSDFSTISNLFLTESYWRDQLCLTWDFHTLHGPANIIPLLQASKTGPRIKSLQLDNSSTLRSPTAKLNDEGKVIEVQAFLTVETEVGRGAGIVKVVAQGTGIWKAFTLFTILTELKGHEEAVGKKRPHGVEHGEHKSQLNWKDRRGVEEAFVGDEEPTVLILGMYTYPTSNKMFTNLATGAGQAGLTVAARLKMLGVKSLIVDREDKVGDNWRTRYHQLVLHDPVWFDHLPYLPFPASWPIFTPKDKLGDWFESYVKLLDLNVWTNANIKKSSWNDSTATWTVEAQRLNQLENGEAVTRLLHPKVRHKNILQNQLLTELAHYSSHRSQW